ncbi:ABC transporter permease [Lactobacillaceae bacterium Scapto_B20]
MNKLMAVISETYSTQVKSKSFIALLLMPIIMILIGVGAGFLGASGVAGGSQDQIAVVADYPTRQALIDSNKDTIDSSIKTVSAAKQKLRSGDIYGYLSVKNVNGRLKINYVGNQNLDGDLKNNVIKEITLQQSQLNVKNSKLTSQQMAQLSIQPSFNSQVKESKHSDDSIIKITSLQILIFILYFFLLMYSGTTASVIAKEKGAKLVEIIFSSTTATTYFLGKIIGIVLVMLTQFLLYAVIFFTSYQLLKDASFMKSVLSGNEHIISQILHNLINVNVIFVLIGLIIFILLSAVCGALVTRKEDANKATQPIMFIIMVCFFAALALQNNSNGIVATILSYFPLSSVFFMPIRIINGQVNALNIVVSLLILILFAVILTYLIIRSYKGLMLQNDDRGLLKKLISGIKYH